MRIAADLAMFQIISPAETKNLRYTALKKRIYDPSSSWSSQRSKQVYSQHSKYAEVRMSWNVSESLNDIVNYVIPSKRILLNYAEVCGCACNKLVLLSIFFWVQRFIFNSSSNILRYSGIFYIIIFDVTYGSFDTNILFLVWLVYPYNNLVP